MSETVWHYDFFTAASPEFKMNCRRVVPSCRESLGVIGKSSTQLLLVNLEAAKDETQLEEYKTWYTDYTIDDRLRNCTFSLSHDETFLGLAGKETALWNYTNNTYTYIEGCKIHQRPLVFSFDDSLLFSMGSKENILWDLETQNKLLDVPVHTAITSDGKFNYDATLIGTVSWDKSIKIIDSKTGQVTIHKEQAHNSYLKAIEFGDNSELYTYGNDLLLKKWDLRKMDTCLFTSKKSQSFIDNLTIISGRKLVEIGGYICQIRDLDTLNLIWNDEIRFAAVSKSGRCLINILNTHWQIFTSNASPYRKVKGSKSSLHD